MFLFWWTYTGESKFILCNGCRNESYHIATQEDSDAEDRYDPPTYNNQSTIPIPTQSHTHSSTVMMIEEDNNKQTMFQQPHKMEV